MNLQDQVVYRCIHAACAHSLPRKVNFCPYCGTGQGEGVATPAPAAVPTAAPVVMAQQTHVADPAPEPSAPVHARAPEPAPAAPAPAPAAPAAPSAPAATAAAAASAPTAAAAAALAPAPAAASSANAGNSANAGYAPKAATVARPPKREPIRTRYWVMALLALWVIWIYARPNTKKIEARVEKAVTLAADCHSSEAQGELIALRETKATPEQLRRLQSAIDSGAAACDKKRRRATAWSDTETAVEAELADGEPTRAAARLAEFTRQYGTDAAVRDLRAKIAAQRKAQAPPPAPVPERAPAPELAPAPAPEAQFSTPLPAPLPTPLPRPLPAPDRRQQSQSARNLINDAEREIARGNYRAASDKLGLCASMVDAGNRECIAYKAYADRLQVDQRRCLASGRDWVRERCM